MKVPTRATCSGFLGVEDLETQVHSPTHSESLPHFLGLRARRTLYITAPHSTDLQTLALSQLLMADDWPLQHIMHTRGIVRRVLEATRRLSQWGRCGVRNAVYPQLDGDGRSARCGVVVGWPVSTKRALRLCLRTARTFSPDTLTIAL